VVQALERLGNRAGVSMYDGQAVYWLDDTEVSVNSLREVLATFNNDDAVKA